MGKTTKGVCVLNANLQSKYPFIQKTTSESDVKCLKCHSRFSISTGGNSDIVRHLKTAKHTAALSAGILFHFIFCKKSELKKFFQYIASSSQSITSHFASTLDHKKIAQEGVWAYHVIKSNQSFSSSDCASKIFNKCFEMKDFTCLAKKLKAIISGVFAPYSKDNIFQELQQVNYVTIYTDASNHGAIKIFPIVVENLLKKSATLEKIKYLRGSLFNPEKNKIYLESKLFSNNG